jgi:hypothetical protein
VACIDRRVADHRCVAYGCWRSLHLCSPIVTDETRAGERGVSPSELLEMLSGEGT